MPAATDPRQALFDALENEVQGGTFPGCVALVWRDGATLYHEAHGVLATHRQVPGWQRAAARDTIYDLASLTKVLCTATLCALAVADGKLSLDTPVPSPWSCACPGASLGDLLAHCSGLAAHREFFAEIPAFDRDAVLAAVAAEEPVYARGTQAVYSDLGFMVLGAWLERRYDRPLVDVFEDLVLYRLGLRGGHPPPLAFRPLTHDPHRGQANAERIAPTEVYDDALHPEGAPSHFACRRQDRYAHGSVHDDNAYVMGGIAGHAGLFGTAEAVLTVARAWLDGSLSGLSAPVRDVFWQASAVPGSSRRLGFDGHSGVDSSAGPALSSAAVGHTGYTGTSLWIDPRDHAIYILLSNRVHPSRSNAQIREARPRFHTVAHALAASSLVDPFP